MEEPKRNPALAFADSPLFGIGIGMLVAVFVSSYSAWWLIGFGWFILSVQSFRSFFLPKGKIVFFASNTLVSILLGLVLIIIWHFTPKPPKPAEPLTKQDIEEIAKNELSTPQNGAPQPDKDKENFHLTTKAELAAAVRAAIDQYKSSETAMNWSNLTIEQLVEQAKSTATEALSKSGEWASRLRGMDDAMKDEIQFQSRPDPDHAGKFISGMDSKDVPAFKKKAQQEQEEFSNEERKSTRNLIARVCGLRAEIITSRLNDRDLKGIPFQIQRKKKDDELCAKIVTSSYGPSDLGVLAV